MPDGNTRRSRLRRILDFLVFRLIPGLLLLAIFWTVIQVISVYQEQSQAAAQFQDRRDAYIATATALAFDQRADEDAGESAKSADGNADASQMRLVAQFATNTPGSGDASEPGAATPAAATPVPQVTPTPPPVETVEKTPIQLPDFYLPPESDVTEIAGTAVPTRVPPIPREYELVNILLLGGDDEVSTDNTVRTDTMIIVSVNTETETVSMLSLPRDLFVYVPTPTMVRLNTVYGIGENIGWQPDGGFGLLRQTIFHNFGINVHYYARVNFTGFEQIIDTLGGVDIAVDCTYRGFYPVDDFDPERPIEENYYMRTLPVGYYTMDGFDALWYVRTRENADDFDRGRRQQLLLRAIFRKARETGLLSNLPELWGQVTEVVETNIPLDVVLGLLPIGLNLDAGDIENFVMIRTYHTTPWQPPSGLFAGQYVQLPNYEPIRQLLVDFYTPPTTSQLALALPSIAVYNGTQNENWDLVAADRLRTEGFNAYAAGPAEARDHEQSVLVDQVGDEKSSIASEIAGHLNIPSQQIRISPDPEREVDYIVTIGQDYNSCTANVLD